MPTIASALNTVFTPAVGDFNVQVTGGEAVLERRNTAAADWAGVGRIQGAVIVSNPIAAAEYRLVSGDASVTLAVRVDQ